MVGVIVVGLAYGLRVSVIVGGIGVKVRLGVKVSVGVELGSRVNVGDGVTNVAVGR